MNKPIVSIIVATSENKVIGRDNKLPWHIPADLKRLKKLTSGHPIIMGRKTYESIGRPLPNRTNIVITRDQEYTAEGTIVVHSLGEALDEAKKVEEEEVFIFGGGEIFRQALPYTDRIYLTIIHQQIEGDVFFPDYSEFKTVVSMEEQPDHNPPFTFITLER